MCTKHLLEQQQHLPWACVHPATALTQFADNLNREGSSADADLLAATGGSYTEVNSEDSEKAARRVQTMQPFGCVRSDEMVGLHVNHRHASFRH